MADNIKPIKRSTALAPLSREHHEGLLFVWKIRQGIKKEIHPERIISYVQWFWMNDLAAHFKKEEKVLLPHLTTREDLRDRLLAEHAHIEDNISVVTHNMYWETLENLAHAIEVHIRFEERELFNEIENGVSPEALNNIGEQLRGDKKCGVWEDVFWEREVI